MNVLEDPLFRSTRGLLTLPECLAASYRAEDIEIGRVQGHQARPWRLMLAQLIALVQASGYDASSESECRRGLSIMSGGTGPWRVFPPLGEVGFLQPSHPAQRYTATVTSPADLELMAAKNFDVRRRPSSDPEQWIFALCHRQTMGWYRGRGHYGGMRSRSAPQPPVYMGSEPRASRLITRSLADSLEAEAMAADPKSHALMWCTPWQPGEQLAPEDVHPLAIEICAPIVLERIQGTVVARLAPQKKPRTAGPATALPWSPRTQAKTGGWFPAAITPAMLNARSLHRILFESELPPTVTRSDETRIVIEGICGSQGRTSGHYAVCVNAERADWRDPVAWTARRRRSEVLLEAISDACFAARRKLTASNRGSLFAREGRASLDALYTEHILQDTSVEYVARLIHKEAARQTMQLLPPPTSRPTRSERW